jgi:hypothetical protein
LVWDPTAWCPEEGKGYLQERSRHSDKLSLDAAGRALSEEDVHNQIEGSTWWSS